MRRSQSARMFVKMRLIWLVAVLCNLEELSRVAMGETVLQVLGRLLADRMPRSYVPGVESVAEVWCSGTEF